MLWKNYNQTNINLIENVFMLQLVFIKVKKIIVLSVTVIKIVISSCLIIYLPSSYAAPTSTTEEKTKSQQTNARSYDAKMLHDSQEWQQFIVKKELADINYDLYRIHGPDVNDRAIDAQDPKGYLVDKHNKMFCSPDIDKRCQASSSLYNYRDMRASILLNNFYKNSEEINLATEVIRNIINPFPSNIALEMRDASNQDREQPEKKAALAEVYASEARLGVARNSFNSMLINRLPLDLLKGKSLNEGKSSSILSIMEQEVKDRFENPEWQKFIQTADQENCLRETLKVQALIAWMLYNGYMQNERKEALLATIVAQQEDLQRSLTASNAQNN